jgi:uncharacterized protein YebE (UPF0316 family)
MFLVLIWEKNFMLMNIIVFFIATLINVILGTLKNVITIKGGRIAASIASAVAYGFNTLMIKLVVSVDIYLAVISSVICNLVGVYIALLITDKLRKDQLWKITVTVPTGILHNFKKSLKDSNIDFIAYETSWEEYKVVDIFSKHKSESKIIRNIIKQYNVKYTISANAGIL